MSTREIWVIGQLRAGAPSPWTLQLVSGARALADADGGTVGVLIAESRHAAALGRHGADRVTVMEGAGETTPAEIVVAAALRTLPPRSIALLPDNLFGRDVAAQIAAGLGAPLLSGCERMQQDGSGVMVVRSCFGGRLSMNVAVEAGAQVATVRDHTFRARASDRRAPEFLQIAVEPDPRISVLERRSPSPEELDVTEAEVLVGGGLGVGPGGFRLLRALAAALGGATAASRAAVDQGWVARSKQVGQTGHRVAPKLYVACGISGAIQHMVGIRDAGTLVALNIDEHAPIMREADLALVGDANEVLPIVLEALAVKERVA